MSRPPSDPVSIAQAYDAAINAGDLERLEDLLDEEAHVWVEGRTLSGRAAALTFIADLRRNFPGIQTIPRVVGATEDTAVCELTIRSSHSVGDADGQWQLAGATCDVIEVRDGRIRLIRNYYQEHVADRTSRAPMPSPGDRYKVADEQAALRRVATLVAKGASEAELFDVVKYQSLPSEGPFVEDVELVAGGGEPETVFATVAREASTLLDQLLRTGNTVRVDDYARGDGELGEYARSIGLQGAVACPVQVGGRIWGSLGATAAAGRPLPDTVERNLTQFADLVAVAIANAGTRAQLRASRARVVTAADDSRRRVQRDVHDGAQQRLVQTITTLKLSLQILRDHDCPGVELVEDSLLHAERASRERRDLVRGILPASLTRGGLQAGVDTLAADLPLDVELDISTPRLPAAIETTAYLVVAEALANVVKHARAGAASVRAAVEEDVLRVSVRDDGVGGAQAGCGTGLTGLFDRVEAGEGSLVIDSPAGGGTAIVASLPIRG